MNSYNSMKSKLEQSGLYKITSGTNVSNELSAYAVALDVMYKELETIERELFIDTASTYGISSREKFFGKERSDKSLSARREILKAFERMTGESTVKAFENTIKSYGVSDFDISENFAGSEVVINIRSALSEAEKELVRSRVEEDFPAHLVITINYA